MARKHTAPKGSFAKGHGLIPGAALYQRLREAISVQGFNEDGSWPTATIDQKGVKALATVQPDPESLIRMTTPELQTARARVWDLVKGMDDLTADVLDAVSCLWIDQATAGEQMVWMTADQFLAFRGLQPHKNAAGRESGYKDQQRRQIAEHLSRLENTWVDVIEMEVLQEYRTPDGKVRRRRKKWKGRSRALIRSSEAGQVTLNGGVDPYAWKLRPGDVFSEFLLGPGRDVVLLSRKALEYDPYRQEVEKRLARFFAYHWRSAVDGESPRFLVSQLLEAAHKPVSARHPITSKSRLERALLTLALDQVITVSGLVEAIERLRPQGDRSPVPELAARLVQSGELILSDFLHGGTFHDEEVGTRGWVDRWLQQVVHVAPPPILLQLYTEVAAASDPEAPAPPQEDSKAHLQATVRKDYTARIAEARELLGLSLAEAAADLGISKSYLAMIESGQRKPSKQVQKRLDAWLTRL